METSLEMYEAMKPYIRDSKYTLEPSAGMGMLSTKLVQKHRCCVDVVELNTERAKFLTKQQLYRKVYHQNFLDWSPSIIAPYDQIVATPPYRENVDCKHIMLMHSLLKEGGILIAYTLPEWTVGIFSIQAIFRSWLNTTKWQAKFIDDKSYTSCPKMLLIIEK